MDSAAGIGGGKNASTTGRRIIIFGGDPSDSSATNAAVMIYGGNITATAHSEGAGIGGGECGHGSVDIYGGNVTATGGESGGAGIGSGNDGGASSIHISGGVVKASFASAEGFGIGNGKSKKGASTITLTYTDETKSGISVTASSYSGTVKLEKDFCSAGASIKAFPAGEYKDTSFTVVGMRGETVVSYDLTPVEVDYIDLNDEPQTELCIPVDNAAVTAWDNGWYAVTKNVTFTGEITVTGDVNLILADDCKLTTAGINVSSGSSLTIWAQTNGTGELKATGGSGSAGIGGGYNSACDVTINGGNITATGGSGGAGIGGGYNSACDVTINGGTVRPTKMNYAAGIGIGSAGNTGSITITGGNVSADGTSTSRAIGDGVGGGNITMLISGGSINAYNYNAIGSPEGTLTLTWTQESRETMRVYSNGYVGKIILERDFLSRFNNCTAIHLLPGELSNSIIES